MSGISGAVAAGSIAATVGSGIAGATAAGGAAEDQRGAANDVFRILEQAGVDARGISRQAAEEYAKSLGLLSPYQKLGGVGTDLLGKAIGDESLIKKNLQANDKQIQDLVAKRNAETDPKKKKALTQKITAARDSFRAKEQERLAGIRSDPGFGTALDQYKEFESPNRQFSSPYSEFSSPNRNFSSPYSEFSSQYTNFNSPNREFSSPYGEFNPTTKPFNPTIQDIQMEPGYEFRRGEGQRGLSNLFGSQGQLLSGNALRGITEYNQDFASNEFGRAYDRELGQNEQAYARELGENSLGYGRDLGENELAYGRDVSENERSYGRDLEQNVLGYARDLGENELAYGRDFSENQLGYGRDLGENALAYGRDLGEYEGAYARDLEAKNRRLGVSQGLIGQGYNAATAGISGAGNLAGLRQNEADIIQNMARSQAGITQDIGNISAAERVAKANAYSDLFTGVAGAGLGYSQSQDQNKLLAELIKQRKG